MAGKRIVYNEDARHALMRGVDNLADAVKVTRVRRDATSSSTRSSDRRRSPRMV